MGFFKDGSPFVELSEEALNLYVGCAFSPINNYLRGLPIERVTEIFFEWMLMTAEDYKSVLNFISHIKNCNIKILPKFESKINKNVIKKTQKIIELFCLTSSYCLDYHFYWRSKPILNQLSGSIVVWRGIGKPFSDVIDKKQIDEFQKSNSLYLKKKHMIIGHQYTYLSTTDIENVALDFLTIWEGGENINRPSFIQSIKNQLFPERRINV